MRDFVIRVVFVLTTVFIIFAIIRAIETTRRLDELEIELLDLERRINVVENDIRMIREEIKENKDDMRLSEVEIVLEPAPVQEPTIDPAYNDSIEYLAKTVYGEARGCSIMEQAAVIWCILNRVDSSLNHMPNEIVEVITQKDQFIGYDASHPVTEEHKKLAKDVLLRWLSEKNGESEVGRVLPKEYLYFYGDGEHNYFTDEWRGGNTWDWELENPYV